MNYAMVFIFIFFIFSNFNKCFCLRESNTVSDVFILIFVFTTLPKHSVAIKLETKKIS